MTYQASKKVVVTVPGDDAVSLAHVLKAAGVPSSPEPMIGGERLTGQNMFCTLAVRSGKDSATCMIVVDPTK